MAAESGRATTRSGQPTPHPDLEHTVLAALKRLRASRSEMIQAKIEMQASQKRLDRISQEHYDHKAQWEAIARTAAE